MDSDILKFNKVNRKEFTEFKLPFIGGSRLYTYSSEVFDHQNKQFTVFTRKIRIIHLGKISGKHRFQLITLEFDTGNTEQVNSKIIKKLSYLFDDIIVTVDETMAIDKVINNAELLIRWELIKEKISKTYKGAEIENYFIALDQILNNEKELIQFFQEYKMFGLFFNGFLQDFPINKNVFFEKLDKNLIANFVNNDADCIEIKLISKANNEEIYYYENSILLDGLIKLVDNDKEYKYKLISLGLRKNPQDLFAKNNRYGGK